jgi:AcrR family transcriptional regulator
VTRAPTVVEQIGPDARRRILDCVYDLFSTRSIRDVGIDEIVQRSGVAKATLYRHFPSKDALVVAFLQLREERWTYAFVEGQARRRGGEGEGALLAIFDVFDTWFRQEDFESCAFINVLLELGEDHPAGRASVEHLENIRGLIRTLAEEAELRDPEEFARSWHILMKGSIISAVEGDHDAALRAQALGRLLIEQHR